MCTEKLLICTDAAETGAKCQTSPFVWMNIGNLHTWQWGSTLEKEYNKDAEMPWPRLLKLSTYR